jgi:hypothetical protein
VRGEARAVATDRPSPAISPATGRGSNRRRVLLALAAAAAAIPLAVLGVWVIIRDKEGKEHVVFGSDGEVVAWPVHGGAARVLDLSTGRIETLLNLTDGRWIVFSPEGHYRCSEGVAEELVYVVEIDSGGQLTLSPDEFAQRYAWRNDPSKITLVGPDEFGVR